jgi:hypothetical protein
LEALAAYRDGIAEIDRIVVSLPSRRARLSERLHDGAPRTIREHAMTDDTQ